MFHVPGWSVSSSSLQTQQTEKKSTAESSKGTEPSTNGSGPDSTARPSKKRKRGGQGRNSATNVTADNLVTLWEKHIEGKAASSHGNAPRNRPSADPTKADNESTKMQKRGHIQTDSGKAAVGENPPAATATRDRSKEKFEKRKLSKQNRHEAQAAGLLPPSRTPAGSAPPTQSQTPSAPAPPPPPPPATSQSGTKLTPLQVTMRQKLISARFRHLNQTLYTTPSTQSQSLFAENPQMFAEYHEGFRKQVEVWPSNPVDSYISAILERGKQRFESQKRRFRKEKAAPTQEEAASSNESALHPLPRIDGLSTIADLGCGDAALARALVPHAKKLKLKLLSFDLQAAHPLVTPADIAHLPLADSSVDVAVFCLALMGTNWIDFVEEAYRVLRWRGELWVAEIKSRFGRVRGGARAAAAAAGPKRVEHSVGKRWKGGKADPKTKAAEDDERGGGVDVDVGLLREIDGADPVAGARGHETDTAAFVEVLRRRGFALKEGPGAVDLENKMFVKLEFVKVLTPSRGKGVVLQSSRGEADGGGGGQGQGKWRPRTRFIDRGDGDGDGDGVAEETAVLKPCVYKLR